MKKIYILAVCLSFVAFTFAQQRVTDKQNQASQSKLFDIDNNNISTHHNKADGDIFWSETFNWENPDDIKGWTLPEGWELGEEGEDFGHFWMWRNDTITGRWTTLAPRTWFITPEDGFIAMPLDGLNNPDGVWSNNAVDSWFQTPAIDCSDKPSVVISFKQYFRTCCTSSGLTMVLQVTNDGGVHWAEYDLKFGTRVNDTPVGDGRNVKINITNVAAGHSEVKMRIYWVGSNSYFWVIDDMTLSEAYHNELKMEDQWALFNNGIPNDEEGFINYIPLSQLNATFGGYSFRSAVVNEGIDDQTAAMLNVEVLKNGVSVYNDNSEGADINTLDRDTFNITNEYLADDYGDYQIKFNGIINLDDQIPENNINEMSFTVNDSIYMRNDKTAEGSAGNNGYTNALNSGDIVGNVFTLTSAVEINSISGFINSMGLDAESDVYAIQYAIFKEDLEGDEDYIEVLTCEYTELDPDVDIWVSVPVDKDGESEFLEPGEYVVGAYLFGTGDDVDIRFGYDMSTDCPTDKSIVKWFGSDSWSTNGKLKMIGINTTERGGPTIAPVTFNVDMNEEIAESLFNPASDFIDVTGTFNDWSGSEAFTDIDGDGIYTLTVPDLSTGETIEYKYRINGNDLTSEADNRSYEVRYWNVLDNTYIFNASSVVDNHDIVEKLIVYPNPTNGMINIVVNNTKQSDLIIEMRDVQGQLIYSNSVNAVLNHREVIDINPAKGMYFLSVNDGSDIKVQKVIVQ